MAVVTVANKIGTLEGFTELDRRLMEELFAHVSLVMLTVVQQWQASHLEQQMSVLVQSVTNLITTPDLDIKATVLGFLEQCAELTGADYVSLHLTDSSGKKKKQSLWHISSVSSSLATGEVNGSWSEGMDRPGSLIRQVLEGGTIHDPLSDYIVASSEEGPPRSNLHSNYIVTLR